MAFGAHHLGSDCSFGSVRCFASQGVEPRTLHSDAHTRRIILFSAVAAH